ncbi:hypothetical protein WICMUC_002347 [Wickerhamomyces mucosus]|uniref:Uncharacterized protein n=1 Tax=Wickerhamomyces mucosus TaxID=1378264 RepID=A0A9P8PR47_9ASCO|nr:hypothetical protein WICMUC_002347 [Wickerhamomyces mucosus]
MLILSHPIEAESTHSSNNTEFIGKDLDIKKSIKASELNVDGHKTQISEPVMNEAIYFTSIIGSNIHRRLNSIFHDNSYHCAQQLQDSHDPEKIIDPFQYPRPGSNISDFSDSQSSQNEYISDEGDGEEFDYYHKKKHTKGCSSPNNASDISCDFSLASSPETSEVGSCSRGKRPKKAKITKALSGSSVAGVYCEHCKKLITRDIRRHMRIHEDVSRFQCVFPREICYHKTGNFNRQYDFKKHLLHCHFQLDSPEAKKSCALSDKLSASGTCPCGMKFNGKDWLENHILTSDKSKKCAFLSNAWELHGGKHNSNHMFTQGSSLPNTELNYRESRTSTMEKVVRDHNESEVCKPMISKASAVLSPTNTSFESSSPSIPFYALSQFSQGPFYGLGVGNQEPKYAYPSQPKVFSTFNVGPTLHQHDSWSSHPFTQYPQICYNENTQKLLQRPIAISQTIPQTIPQTNQPQQIYSQLAASHIYSPLNDSLYLSQPQQEPYHQSYIPCHYQPELQYSFQYQGFQ